MYVLPRVWQTNCPILVHVLILALDTSSSFGSIAVLRNQRPIGVLSTASEETYSSRMFRQLEFLLGELSLQLGDFDLFAVNAGPGSFTGLRVGLTTAKAWAEVYGKPLAAVGGLEAVASQDLAPAVVPVLDARRGELYAGFYRRPGGPGKALTRVEEAVLTPEQFIAWLNDSPERCASPLVTPAAEWLAALLSAQNGGGEFAIREVSPVLAPVIGALAYERAQRGETTDALRLDANYIRRPDAERNWKET